MLIPILTKAQQHREDLRLLTHLSTLHVSPHGSFATNGKTSSVQNSQHKNREWSKEKGDHSKDDACGRLSDDGWKRRRDVT